MPQEITVHAVLVWFAIGFFAGLGWTIAAKLLSIAFAVLGHE